MQVRDVIGPGSPLSRSLPEYEDRPAQLAMAAAVEAALADDKALFVEAGTGTGKTLAYLVPAILSGKKVVVSTATRALQEQIYDKDLPLVAKALAPHGVTFRATLMKGLSNYLCKRRFGELFVGLPIDVETRALARIDRWARETVTGDRAELTDVAEDAPAWREVQSSTETRIGAACPHFDACFVTRMRQKAEGAQVIVVNHHLFFADLALRIGRSGEYASAIPNYDAVIFDEAHQIESIATDFFGVRVSTARVDALARDGARSLAASAKRDGAKGESEALQRILEQVETATQVFFEALVPPARMDGAADLRRTLLPGDFGEAVLTAYDKLDASLEVLAARAEDVDKDEAIQIIGRRTRDLRSDLRSIVRGLNGDLAAESRVAWLNVGDRALSIGASPIELGPMLRTALFDRVPSVVCTSATLATFSAAGASFHFAKARLGAPTETRELVVASPFDFASRAALYLPRDLPEPSDPAFEDAAVERIAQLIQLTCGGAFVLCTSTRAMKRFHARISKRLEGPVMVQGQAPKHTLLDRFRESGNAVLVATMSFWEGVDVPGRALRLVIVDKIPFAVPTDPVVQARSQKVAREGGNAFSEYAVPTAAIALKQGFGRLIRTQKDAGIVAVLDRRIVTKGYGRMLVASLPPALRVGDWERLRAFWERVGPTLG